MKNGLYLPFLALLFDCFLWSVFDYWFFYGALLFLVQLLFSSASRFLGPLPYMLSFFAVLLEDFLITGRVGFCLFYLVPIVWFGLKMRPIVHQGDRILPLLTFTGAFFFHQFARFEVVGGVAFRGGYSTIGAFLCNITVMVFSLKFLSMRSAQGNRSFRSLWAP